MLGAGELHLEVHNIIISVFITHILNDLLTTGRNSFYRVQRALKDLKERFAKIDIQASDPIVPYRETCVRGAEMAPVKTPGAPRGTIHGVSALGAVKFTIRAAPLPATILTFLQDNLVVLKRLLREGKMTDQEHAAAEADSAQEGIKEKEGEKDEEFDDSAVVYGEVPRKPTTRVENFWADFEAVCKAAGSEWVNVARNAWAFGPQAAGTCVLVDNREGGPFDSCGFLQLGHADRILTLFCSQAEPVAQLDRPKGPSQPRRGKYY